MNKQEYESGRLSLLQCLWSELSEVLERYPNDIVDVVLTKATSNITGINGAGIKKNLRSYAFKE